MNLRRHSPKEEEVNIELAPLIDVVFILLIFFMVSTTFTRESELEVDLPEASAEPSQIEAQTIIVSIDKQGRYAIDGKMLINKQSATLKRSLERSMKAHESPSLLISADGDAPHHAVVTVMDAARQVGLTKMGLATESVKVAP
jgi:biopolymer transport protein ExbD